MPEATTNLIRNSILYYWDKIHRARQGAALLSPAGAIMRTWQDVDDEASAFSKEIGVGRGTVAVQVGNDPSLPAILVACWRSGRAAVLHEAELFGEARARIERELGVTLRISRPMSGELEFALLDNEERDESEVCFYKVTAGIAGGIRAIGFSSDQLLADCNQVSESMGISSDDVNFGLVGFSHSYGFSSLITPVLCRGTALVVAGDSLPWAIEAGLRLTKASVAPLVPAMFRALLSVPEVPSSLRLCISAGVALDPVLAADFHRRFGLKIHSFYGTSDCGGICYDSSEEVVEAVGFVGQPVSGVSVELCASAGVAGSRIKVRSAATGYPGGSNLGAQDPCDLLVQGPGGFFIVGKETDIINVAGKKVHPSVIEAVLLTIPGVEDAVVFGSSNLHRGEEVIALIISQEPVDATSVRRHCANHLPAWQVPRKVIVRDSMPPNYARNRS